MTDRELSPLETAVRKLVATNTRRLRNAKGWSQEMLAEFAGMHPTEVSRLERGERSARALTLVRLATALSVTVDVLLTPPPVRARS